jgi:hypothetical protein
MAADRAVGPSPNRFARKAAVMAVYTATELFMLQDESEDFASTKLVLDIKYCADFYVLYAFREFLTNSVKAFEEGRQSSAVGSILAYITQMSSQR